MLQSAGAYEYAQFADWWVRSIAAYTAQGVVPDYISIQNEPDFFNAGWETCQLDTAEDATNAGYGRALDAVVGRDRRLDAGHEAADRRPRELRRQQRRAALSE